MKNPITHGRSLTRVQHEIKDEILMDYTYISKLDALKKYSDRYPIHDILQAWKYIESNDLW